MTILASLGGDAKHEAVLDVAKDLADTYGEELAVLHVIPEDDFGDHLDEMRDLPEMGNYSIEQQEQSAKRVAERLTRSVLDDVSGIAFHGRVGKPAEDIKSVAGEVDARFVVIGGRKRSPTGKALFGSETQSILLNADRPIVTVMGEN